jgi:hypothetical protein
LRAKWGIAWLLVGIWLAMALLAPAPVLAAGDFSFRSIPILPIEAQSSLEAQMLGEKPLKPATPHIPGLEPGLIRQLQLDGQDVRLSLPFSTEMNISIRYNRDNNPVDQKQLGNSPLYMKYAMDYRLLPNLRVGLNGYFYRPSEDHFAFQNHAADHLLGMGPELKYDLGRWSFLLKSQVESSSRDQGKDLQNWFRVWYAF